MKSYWILLGAALLGQKKYASAEPAYARAARYEPQNYRAHYGHGVALQMLNRFAEAIRAAIEKTAAPIQLRGPAPAPVSKLKRFWRYHFQLIADEFEPIRELWLNVRDDFPSHPGVEFVIDVDALNLR